ncbi:MAG: hypothetical protein AAF465_03300 [Pseudomonadota bacterium]
MPPFPAQSHSLPLRAAGDVMDPSRLGAHYPTRLSFMRVLTRKLIQDKWVIDRSHFHLGPDGNGEVHYTITTPNDHFTFVAFIHALDDDERSDRVIAERWDLTATLCGGAVSAEHLQKLRENVPLQEKGRLDSRSIVLTRANKSSRNFEYVVAQLASGHQPSADALAQTGYLYRTTAVYGSSKFGMADWSFVRSRFPDFSTPFAAEMFSCYLLRQVSFDIAEHLAHLRAPTTACSLSADVKRYLGIGNATGLGMAPFLICRPLLIHQWMACRELALARVRASGPATDRTRARLISLLRRARQHLNETVTGNEEQNAINATAATNLGHIIDFLRHTDCHWDQLIEESARWCLDSQEVVVACLIELFPRLVDDLTQSMTSDEHYDIRPEQSLRSLRDTLEHHYDWSLAIDFDDPASRRMFWYRSIEKMEPRLGDIQVDEGVDRQLHLDIALQVSELYDYVCEHLRRHPDERVAHFLIQFPMLRYIVRRVQTMAQTLYGEIRENMLSAKVAPTKLMRAKLSFFGASKFDPKSRLWVRNTMFQGAPTVDDLTATPVGERAELGINTTLDDWNFPLLPQHDATV